MLARIRRIVQILFFLFFLLLFLLARYPYSGRIPADLFLRFSPLMPLFDFIKHLHVSLLFWPALIILLITPFLGRVFCGWVCPLGTLLDISSKFLHPPDNLISKKWQKLRSAKFMLLTGLIILAVLSVHLWGYFDPLSIFNRALAIIFYPLFTVIAENTLLGLTSLPLIGNLSGGLYDGFKNIIMPEAQAHFQQLFWILLFIAVIIGLEKISRRFWCRYLCPAGALLGILSKFRLLERNVSNSCVLCNQCQSACKMNAIPFDDPFHTSKVECIQCFSCASTCPSKISAISYTWKWKPYQSKVDLNRRQFLQTGAASVIAVGLLNLPLPNKDKKERLLRPPGALAEDEFLDRCIRCEECVRICSTNGACLQPGSIHTDLRQLWVPEANMRTGYCEYNCNLCTQVCPTRAIQPLTLAEKQKTVIGIAVFNKNICIPYERNENCMVCEEHCPTEKKAIQFNIKQVKQADGSVKEVKYPYVIRELCIGCGICENKCPLPGESGIFVVRQAQEEEYEGYVS